MSIFWIYIYIRALTPKKVRIYLAKELNVPPSELESIKTYISHITAVFKSNIFSRMKLKG